MAIDWALAEKVLKPSYNNIIDEEAKVKPLRLIKRNETQQQQQELNKVVADNLRHSEALRREINLDLKSDAAIGKVLDKSLKCISLMTGDEVFYKQNRESLNKYKKKYNKILEAYNKLIKRLELDEEKLKIVLRLAEMTEEETIEETQILLKTLGYLLEEHIKEYTQEEALKGFKIT